MLRLEDIRAKHQRSMKSIDDVADQVLIQVAEAKNPQQKITGLAKKYGYGKNLKLFAEKMLEATDQDIYDFASIMGSYARSLNMKRFEKFVLANFRFAKDNILIAGVREGNTDFLLYLCDAAKDAAVQMNISGSRIGLDSMLLHDRLNGYSYGIYAAHDHKAFRDAVSIGNPLMQIIRYHHDHMPTGQYLQKEKVFETYACFTLHLIRKNTI